MFKRKGWLSRFFYKKTEDILYQRLRELDKNDINRNIYKSLRRWHEFYKDTRRDKYLLLEELLGLSHSFQLGRDWVWSLEYEGIRFYLLYNGVRLSLQVSDSSIEIGGILNQLYIRLVWNKLRSRYRMK